MTPQLTEILFYLAGLVLLAVAVITAGIVISRTLRKRINDPVKDGAFTLSDLRRLHKQGQLSDAEFERAKGAMVARQRAAMDRGTDPIQGPPGTNRDDGDDPTDKQ